MTPVLKHTFMRIKPFIIIAWVFLCIANCSDSDSVQAPISKPIAYNDLYTTLQNRDIVISDILKNDDNTKDISLELNNSSTKGKLENSNGIITFIPKNNFVGTDSFTYTICETIENNCSTATVFIKVEEGSTSLAIKDSYSTIANKVLIIDDLTSNDVLDSDFNISIKSVDKTSTTEGNIELNNGIVTYTPKADFVGEDIFTYTICDENENCSSATVTITVSEGINAVDDNYNTSNTNILTILDLLNNDSIVNGTKIKELGTSMTAGTVTLESDESIVYSPPADFTGDDTFTYTICDDATPPNESCSTATVTISVFETISFNIPSALIDYYDGVLFSENSDAMFNELDMHTKSNHTTILSYGERHQFLYDADEDLSNSDNVILMYSSESRYWEEYTSGSNTYSPQTFNTEHVYPQSRLSAADSRTDLHHLRSCDTNINSDRSNFPFTDGSGTYKLLGKIGRAHV